MTPQFQYFDCYDTEDDIIFVDCLADLPGTFNNYLDYYFSCYFDCFNQPISLQEAFASNTNNVAVVSDLDKAPRVSVSDTSTTKVYNMKCLNVPEKEKIPLSLMDYLQLIPKLKIELLKKKNTPSLSEKTNIDLFQLDVLYTLDKEKQSKLYTLSKK